MCGIAGYSRFTAGWGSLDTLKAMGLAMKHRGPDAAGEHLEENVGLSHRRLSIVDLSDAGKQPMISANGQTIITFNGEIYNFQALRTELEQQGVRFQSHTDTEVILELYNREGVRLLERINGMFAFAIWDRTKKQLFIARDRLGKKPLYYYLNGNDIAFASELKSLLMLDGIPKRVRLDAVHDFFAYQYIPDPKTIYEDIYKLEPGHYITINSQKIQKKQYWDLSFDHTNNGNNADQEHELLSLLQGATRLRMVADVPLGAFLSGGIDSSGVVALMASSSENPVTTCSIGFDEERFNETEFAGLVAKQYSTDHHEFQVHDNVSDNLESIASYFDEPFADPSLVPTFFVSRLARRKVTVALAGDGGDEIFAGYEKYSTDFIENRIRKMFPHWIRKNLFPLASRIVASINIPLFRKAGSLLNSLSHDAAMGFFISNSQITDELWEQLVKPEIKNKLGEYHPSKVTLDHYFAADGPDHLSRILYADIKTYLPGDILVKVDRMSMANSLEVRAPILDRDVVEFAASIPSNRKFRKGEKKYILKKSFEKLLPKDILYRKKMGFSVPLANWLRQELREFAQERLIECKSGLVDVFRPDEILRLWNEHQNHRQDHSTVLWSMLMYQLWWEKYMAVPDHG